MYINRKLATRTRKRRHWDRIMDNMRKPPPKQTFSRHTFPDANIKTMPFEDAMAMMGMNPDGSTKKPAKATRSKQPKDFCK